MKDFIVHTGILLIFLISSYGWGRGTAQLIYRTAPKSWAYTITLGLGMLILIGGVLNLLRIAMPMALEFLLSLGLGISCVFAALAIRSNATSFSPLSLLHSLRKPSWYRSHLTGDLIPILILLAAAGFFTATLMPVSAFNIHDDFQKYLVAPFQMLHSGTLGGTAFQVVGLHNLGSQSYLQSFVLTRFPITYINWFDIIFCFFIAGILVNDIGKKANVHPLYRTFAIISFVFINPQYMNISALYSGSVFILGMIYAALLFADTFEDSDSLRSYLAAVPFGLLAASLISLKATFVPFSLLFGGLIFLVFLVLVGKAKLMTIVSCVVIGTAGLVLVPWILISHNNYGRIVIDVIRNAKDKGFEDKGTITNIEWLMELLFSQKILGAGGTLLDYNFAIFTLMAAVLISIFLLLRNRERQNRIYIAVGLVACISTIAVYFINGHITHYLDDTVRYSVPIIIAVLPASILVLGRGFWEFQGEATGRLAPAFPIAIIFAALQILVVGLFANEFLNRISTAKNSRTALSTRLRDSQSFLEYNRFALSNKTHAHIRNIQSKTTVGSKIFLWFSMPFHFNFKRNSILNMEFARLVMEHTDGSFGSDTEKFREFLKGTGVRYVLWQSRGGMESEDSLREDSQIPNLRREAQSKLKLRGLLKSLEKRSTILIKSAIWTLYDIDNE